MVTHQVDSEWSLNSSDCCDVTNEFSDQWFQIRATRLSHCGDGQIDGLVVNQRWHPFTGVQYVSSLIPHKFTPRAVFSLVARPQKAWVPHLKCCCHRVWMLRHTVRHIFFGEWLSSAIHDTPRQTLNSILLSAPPSNISSTALYKSSYLHISTYLFVLTDYEKMRIVVGYVLLSSSTSWDLVISYILPVNCRFLRLATHPDIGRYSHPFLHVWWHDTENTVMTLELCCSHVYKIHVITLLQPSSSIVHFLFHLTVLMAAQMESCTP